MSPLTKVETRDLYRRRARHYDPVVWLFRAAGFHEARYRRDAVEALQISPGDTVVELGCGTGRNFPLLQSAVGATGRVIGVDLTDAMLAQADRRIRVAGWDNVSLVEHDMSTYEFPPVVHRVLSTFAITLVPEYDSIITRTAGALQPAGRLAVLDFKEPARWPSWLVRFAAWVNRPFGVSLDLAERHPWEVIRRELREVRYREFYAGAIYLCAGERERTRSEPGNHAAN